VAELDGGMASVHNAIAATTIGVVAVQVFARGNDLVRDVRYPTRTEDRMGIDGSLVSPRMASPYSRRRRQALTPQTANSPRVDSLQEGRTRGLLLV
jgi:hypothetical protein